MSSSFIIRAATASEVPDACRLLAHFRGPERRPTQAAAYLAPLTNGTIDPAGLLVAEAAPGELLTLDCVATIVAGEVARS